LLGVVLLTGAVRADKLNVREKYEENLIASATARHKLSRLAIQTINEVAPRDHITFVGHIERGLG